MTGKTSTGFRFKTNDKALEDYRFQKAITTIEVGNEVEKLYASTQLVILLLGEKGEKALCKHVTEADGTIPSSKIYREIGEILSLMKGNIKNS